MSINTSCSFRIIGLTDVQLVNLVDSYLNDIVYRKGSDHKDFSKKILRLVLDENSNPALLLQLLRESPKDVYYDFFVSASSSDESVVIEIPEFVLSLHEKVGGKFCFSYTCT